MEKSDHSGYWLDPGVVYIRLEQRRCSVRRAAEIGGNIHPEIIKPANEVKPATTQVHAIIEVRKLGVLVHRLEVPAHIELTQPANGERRPAIRRGDGRPPFGHAELDPRWLGGNSDSCSCRCFRLGCLRRASCRAGPPVLMRSCHRL